MPAQAQHFHQTRAKGKCGNEGYIVKAMLAWADIIVSTMVRLILYTRSVADIQSGPLFPPGSRAAQRRETPGNRFEENSSCESCIVGMAWVGRSCHHRTPMGGRGPRLLLELWAEGSESRGTEWLLSPLFALALAEPVRLRT